LIYLDTSPLIYLLEEHPTYHLGIDAYLRNASKKNEKFATSIITRSEYAVQPIRLGQPYMLMLYDSLINGMDYYVFDINKRILAEAAQLRATHPALHLIDAIHLATAVQAGCTVFVTNDKRLKTYAPLPVLLVAELTA